MYFKRFIGATLNFTEQKKTNLVRLLIFLEHREKQMTVRRVERCLGKQRAPTNLRKLQKTSTDS